MRTIVFAAFSLLFSLSARGALTADNLLLIVNKNEPASRKLADHYAESRQVPAGRIVELDLPTGDEISIDAFDRDVVAPIRKFLKDNQLERQVTCLVTFYGVPLRIPNRAASLEIDAEVISLRAQSNAAAKQAKVLVDALEKLARQANPSFKPLPAPATDSVELLPSRADVAAHSLGQSLQKLPPGQARTDLENAARALSEKFRAPVKVAEPTTVGAVPELVAPASQPAALTPQEFSLRVNELSVRRWDRTERRALRDFVRLQGGILPFMQILSAQEQYLASAETEAAVDNELPALWWGLYPRYRWQGNPLRYRASDPNARPTLMVARLDAGTSDQVEGIIDTSIQVERDGLKGTVAIDSRGIPARGANGKPDGYGSYDQTIRDLATLLRAHTKLPLVIDDRPELIAPGSVKDCAVYCGWYSPGKYVPSVSFASGGVAMHIASYELTVLHNQTTAWCRNQLDAGAVATIGPVGEPLLHAFPLADDFFPLLMTGKLTLAETYWATCPLLSWKMALIGDPLYTPFKTNPALSPQDLPMRLRAIFALPTTNQGQ